MYVELSDKIVKRGSQDICAAWALQYEQTRPRIVQTSTNPRFS
jgi:hypothetical protein